MSEAAQILDKVEAKPEIPQEKMGEGVAKDGSPQPSNGGEKVSSKIELLIRREQQALARERQVKEREAQFDAKMKAFEEREGRLNEFESNKKDPKKALGLLGLSYDEITQAHLNDGELPPQIEIKKLREEIEEYKAAQSKEKDYEKERALDEAKKQAEAQESKAITEFKGNINQYLSDNSARYEYIAFEANQDLVFDVIDEHYNRTLDAETGIGKVMSIKDAADKVEEHLEQKYAKAKELNKTKALWGAIPKEAQKQVAKEVKIPTPPRTLTNQLSATAASPLKSGKLITDQERVQKAIAYAKGLRP